MFSFRVVYMGLRSSLGLVLLLVVGATGFTLRPTVQSHGTRREAASRWLSVPRMEFGEAFYMGYNYAAQYGPQLGDPILPKEGDTWEPAMPEGWVEVALRSPLGIVFEENEQTIGPVGVKVLDLVQDGNAAKTGKVEKGDQLVGITGYAASPSYSRAHARRVLLRQDPSDGRQV